jgi:hypothetical protein
LQHGVRRRMYCNFGRLKQLQLRAQLLQFAVQPLKVSDLVCQNDIDFCQAAERCAKQTDLPWTDVENGWSNGPKSSVTNSHLCSFSSKPIVLPLCRIVSKSSISTPISPPNDPSSMYHRLNCDFNTLASVYAVAQNNNAPSFFDTDRNSPNKDETTSYNMSK